MILAVPLSTSPSTPETWAAKQAERANYAFGDLHARRVPCYLRRTADKGIELEITEEDRALPEHTVDFVSFSYYMSVCETVTQSAELAGQPSWAAFQSHLEALQSNGRSTWRACAPSSTTTGPLGQAPVHRRERLGAKDVSC